MLGKHDRARALDQKIDSLIERYGHENPELVSELSALKVELQAAQERGAAAQVASVAFRIATWARFFVDHWSDL